MDALISSLGGSSLGGGVQKLEGKNVCYISEVSSPTRLWIQVANDQNWVKINEMKNFYSTRSHEEFALQPHQIMIGMRIVAFTCREWDRAEVLSSVNAAGIVKLFFIDFGTNGFVSYKNCKMLVEEYAVLPKQAIRAALHGIKPVRNSRLWSFGVTQSFINLIRNKTHLLEIVKYHDHEDFYEFLLYDENEAIVNDKLVENQLADKADRYQPPSCLIYPSFNMLEKLVIYPTYGERFRMFKSDGVDFNEFEEKNIPLATNASTFESELGKLLNDQRFVAIKNAFKNIYGVY